VFTEECIMKNVTITLAEDVATWARIRAAERGMSLSRYIAEMISDLRMRKDDQTGVLDRWLEHPGWHSGGGPLPSREEIYDRSLLPGHQRADLQPGSRRTGKISRGKTVDRPTKKNEHARPQRAKRS
jgi:hypothetical protein